MIATINDEKGKTGNLSLTLEDPNGDYRDIYDALESDGGLTGGLIGNGWRIISPEQIGALIGDDCLILTQDWDEDDQGNITRLGDYWYHNEYAIRDPLDCLREDGCLSLTKGPNDYSPVAKKVNIEKESKIRSDINRIWGNS